MARQFEIYKDVGGQYRFRLKSRNGDIVATGESYPTKAAVKKGSRRFREQPTAPTSSTSTKDKGMGRPCVHGAGGTHVDVTVGSRSTSGAAGRPRRPRRRDGVGRG